MPDWKRLDWEQYVRERLAAHGTARTLASEVVAELAAHLEEIYDEASARGLSCEEALAHSLQEVGDWRVLGAEIARAKSREGTMNHRTKTVWLPGIAILFAIGLWLVFLDRAATLQRFIWLACMAMLLGAARSEWSRLNQRTRSVWLPGFVSLAAASLSLFAAEILLMRDPSYYLTDGGLRPGHPISLSGFRFYLAWLVSQVFCGAVAAFLSRRAQGSLRARVVAAAFPAIVMLAVWTLVIPLSALAQHNAFVWHHPLYYLLGVFIWVVPPAIALVGGAVPFLRDMRPVED